jgi:hypothetical protein
MALYCCDYRLSGYIWSEKINKYSYSNLTRNIFNPYALEAGGWTHLLDLLEDAEEVEAGEALQFFNAPLAGGVQGGEQLHVLGHVLQPRGDPAQCTCHGRRSVFVTDSLGCAV